MALLNEMNETLSYVLFFRQLSKRGQVFSVMRDTEPPWEAIINKLETASTILPGPRYKNIDPQIKVIAELKRAPLPGGAGSTCRIRWAL